MQEPYLTRARPLTCLIVVACLAACAKTEEDAAPPANAPATAAAPSSANVHAFRIGELTAYAVRDGGMELPNDNNVFGVGRTPEEVAALLGAAGAPGDKLQLSVQPLLVKAPDRVLLFDTGAGALFGPGTGHLQKSFAEAGIDPQSVTDIFISHHHGDHVGGLVNADGALAFPNATIHLSAPEWKYMSGLEHYAALNAAITPRVDAFAPGAELIPGVVKAVEIAGHTPGHSGYRITSGSEALLYVGDSMHHYVISVQAPQWTIAFDGDSLVATASRMALIGELAASGERVYSVHFPFPGLGKMQKQGDTTVWVGE